MANRKQKETAVNLENNSSVEFAGNDDDQEQTIGRLVPRSKLAEELVAEVSIPISEELAREFPIHLDVTLPPPSATTLRRIAIALDRQQARTSDGQRVVKPTQALRWLLEQATIRPVQTTNQE
jgi:hypothetical protein